MRLLGFILGFVLMFAACWAKACPGTLDNGDKAVCSATWQLYGTCTGEDMVYSWTVAGAPGVQGWQMHPWLDTPAYIVGVELTNLQPGDGHGWYMVGNNMQGDAMGFMEAGSNRVMQWFPPGKSWRVPPSSQDDGKKYLDVHGWCAAGRWATLMLNVYYTQ